MSSCAAETGLVAMDCLVVCCCCPCLVLQVTVFLFVRLPKKVVVKTKRIILRRWHRRRPTSSSRGVGCAASGLKLAELLDLDDAGFEAAFGVVGEGCTDGGGWREMCFPVVDNDDGDGVWASIIEQEGLFWFGSFWGRPEQEGSGAGGDDRMDGSFRLPVALERVCE
ncbi:hypothetical protein BS78_04G250000 [Paspalum vaginatum]|nr:hypothetical protein BS78_04G250000 [Paspalum vaginatum]